MAKGIKVDLAKKTGFCFGVKRAIDMSEAALKDNGKVYSLGSVIHNKQVVSELAGKGLTVIDDIEEVREGVIVASSHGISPKVAERVRKRGMDLIDTTCPFVLNAQRIAKGLGDEGYTVVIVGDAAHPEVKALVDFVAGDVFVVKDKREAKALNLKPNAKVSIISQTTQSMDNFLGVAKAILDKRPKEFKVVNTICKDVEERQEAAREIAKKADVMFVVGGKNSANTRRLFEISRRIAKRTYLVETEGDLDAVSFKAKSIIGVTSGASTPDSIVKRVVEKIKRKGGCIING